MKVSANFDTIDRQTSIIDGELSDFRSGITTLRNTLNNISYIWKDSSGVNFQNKMSELLTELSKLENSIETFNTYIKGYSNSHYLLDSMYKSKNVSIK